MHIGKRGYSAPMSTLGRTLFRAFDPESALQLEETNLHLAYRSSSSPLFLSKLNEGIEDSGRRKEHFSAFAGPSVR